MSYHSLNNIQFGKVTGFNSYRFRQGQLNGFSPYGNSIYGNPRNVFSSRFNNPAAFRAYTEFMEEQAERRQNRNVLMIGLGLAASWFLGDGNAEKTGNAISNLFNKIGSWFSGNKKEKLEQTPTLEPKTFDGPLEVNNSNPTSENPDAYAPEVNPPEDDGSGIA